ncbi:MAG TPA: folylpolyglutamate synthase/dihydrofolate synthase family protein [Spirochaetota bacterium]|nr:folylpolyglutamate synthase/dihydrofolate synthase family protein [Spirochaetota bacterium]HPU90018.1 folylpolyglutamate synthase/dihydrofolate synthase family protein [Spirochaetota bacterium]
MNLEKRLAGLINNEARAHGFVDYSPDHIARLLELHGNPHRRLAAVHIAGTNGKGSTAHMIARIAQTAGYKTGLYTSPHLLRIHERIRIQGRPIPDSALNRLADMAFNALAAHPDIAVTYFDALTFIAFAYFAEERVDLAVIETGLGGRLDSTNVVTPRVSVITDIALDHTRVLGSTIPQIAREKAGIIKPGVPVVTTNTAPGTVAVLADACRGQRSALFRYGHDFFARLSGEKGEDRTVIDISAAVGSSPPINLQRLPFDGRAPVQMKNAAAAIATALCLTARGFTITPAHMRAGVSARVPGRLQLLSKSPPVLFDPAHNPAAVRAVADAIRASYPDRRVHAVVSFMRDKDAAGMVRALAPLCASLHYLNIDDARSRTITPGAAGRAWRNMLVPIDTLDALATRLSRMCAPTDLVVFTGSFRLYRHARDFARLRAKAASAPAPFF